MKKFRLYYDKDKETAWLNEMAAQGYAMTKFFAGLYTFEECTPEKYTYQVDFGDRLFGVSEDYRDFMRENNIEIVQTCGFWIILRKLASNGPFLLYTDIDSSIEHYTKIRNMFKGASIFMIIAFFFECWCALEVPVCILYAVIIGLLLLVMINAAFKTNQKINELKEQKGETVKTPGNPSPILIAGLLLNSSSLVSVNAPDYILIPIRVIAIILMIYGIVKTFSNSKPKS